VHVFAALDLVVTRSAVTEDFGAVTRSSFLGRGLHRRDAALIPETRPPFVDNGRHRRDAAAIAVTRPPSP
jgi:hypothetical protein